MTIEEAIQFLDNMKHEEAGRAIGKDGFYAELIGYHVEALNMAIKALERMAPPDCESVTHEERTEDEEVITLRKGTLKAVTGRFVVYDREWLKEHFNTTEAYLYGINVGDLISRQAVLDLAKSGKLVSNGNYKSVCDAINGLPSVEMEKCGDCISRIDILKKLNNLCNNICEYSKKQRKSMCDACNLSFVFDMINNAKSVESERKPGRWIPVSERLPGPKKDVVVWTIQGNKPRHFVAALFPHKTDGYVWIGEEEIHLYPEQVLYWMPLPNPPVKDKNVGKEESHE